MRRLWQVFSSCEHTIATPIAVRVACCCSTTIHLCKLSVTERARDGPVVANLIYLSASVYRFVSWLVGWLVGWLFCWLVGGVAGG